MQILPTKIALCKLHNLLWISLLTIACNNSNSPSKSISSVFKKDIINITNLSAIIGKWAEGNEINLQAYDTQLDSLGMYVHEKNIKEFYTKNNKASIWLSAKGVSENAKPLIKLMSLLGSQGIDTANYKLHFLKKLAEHINNGKAPDAELAKYELGMTYALTRSVSDLKLGNIAMKEADYYNKNDTNFNVVNYCLEKIKNNDIANIYIGLSPELPLYKTLQQELNNLQAIKAKGGWPIISGLKDSLNGTNLGTAIITLRKRLNIEIGIPKDTVNALYSEDLLSAIKQFQYKHDIRITGRLDTATLRRINYTVDNKINWVNNNMDRIRKLNQKFTQPYVWVNIPQMQLQYVNKDSVQYKMRTVVGRTSRATPTLDAPMTNIVINPNWSVPPTIMKEEIVPGIKRKGGDYLTRRGLTAYLGSRKVDPRMINDKNFKRYRIEQKPGLNSSLGAVKFKLTNVHSI